jgi:hypothetical protein
MKTLFTFLLLAVAASVCDAQFGSSVSLQPHRGPFKENSPVTPTGKVASVSQTGFLNTSTALDSFFTGYMAAYHIPGLVDCYDDCLTSV